MSLTDSSITEIPTKELRLSILMANEAIFSDVHANLEALVAVLTHIEGQGVDRIVSNGDLTGYGADPIACIDLVRGLAEGYPLPKRTRRQIDAEFPGFMEVYERLKSKITEFVVRRGNHEEGLMVGPFGFNNIARDAIDWTKKQVKPNKWYQNIFARWSEVAKRWQYLQKIDATKLMHENGRILYVHGSPIDPLMAYIKPENAEDDLFGFMDPVLRQAFEGMKSDILCFVGHTHEPLIVDSDGQVYDLNETLDLLKLPKKTKVIVNEGSVGQPRDGDNRACYATLKQGKLRIHRPPYNIDGAANKIRAVSSLDDELADRLYEAY